MALKFKLRRERFVANITSNWIFFYPVYWTSFRQSGVRVLGLLVTANIFLSWILILICDITRVISNLTSKA